MLCQELSKRSWAGWTRPDFPRAGESRSLAGWTRPDFPRAGESRSNWARCLKMMLIATMLKMKDLSRKCFPATHVSIRTKRAV